MFEWYVFKFIVSIEYRFQKGHLYNKWQYLVGLQSFFATNHFAANFYIVFEEFVQKILFTAGEYFVTGIIMKFCEISRAEIFWAFEWIVAVSLCYVFSDYLWRTIDGFNPDAEINFVSFKTVICHIPVFYFYDKQWFIMDINMARKLLQYKS